jgi:hypothetical protein
MAEADMTEDDRDERKDRPRDPGAKPTGEREAAERKRGVTPLDKKIPEPADTQRRRTEWFKQRTGK